MADKAVKRTSPKEDLFRELLRGHPDDDLAISAAAERVAFCHIMIGSFVAGKLAEKNKDFKIWHINQRVRR